ncbi:alpha/beta hydrolase [Myxococcota bacterium]|nr:alpha/beta hydrolase [Myxococcota bacterium]
MDQSRVSFLGHGGTELAGILYLPEARDSCPGIVMTHGFSAVKEMCLREFAEAFCEAGFAVLLYDHRNLGESGGEPRQEINPWAQVRDYRYALTWLSERPEVDAEKLAVWGNSFSGGAVLVLAAVDRRVKAVVANVPLTGFPGVDYSDSKATFDLIQEIVLDEGNDGLAGRSVGEPTRLRVVEDGQTGPPAFLNQPESSRWFLRVGERPGSTWRNDVTLVNAFDCEPRFDPGFCIAHIAPTPLLMVVASEDNLTPASTAEAAFKRAGEPKQWVTVEGDHFASCEGSAWEYVSRLTCRFLVESLG